MSKKHRNFESTFLDCSLLMCLLAFSCSLSRTALSLVSLEISSCNLVIFCSRPCNFASAPQNLPLSAMNLPLGVTPYSRRAVRGLLARNSLDASPYWVARPYIWMNTSIQTYGWTWIWNGEKHQIGPFNPFQTPRTREIHTQNRVDPEQGRLTSGPIHSFPKDRFHEKLL